MEIVVILIKMWNAPTYLKKIRMTYTVYMVKVGYG